MHLQNHITHCYSLLFPTSPLQKTHTHTLTVTWMDTHASWLVSRVLNVGNHDGRRSLAGAEDDPQRENHVMFSLLQPAITATSDRCSAMGPSC